MSEAKEYYDRTYGMTFARYCKLATQDYTPCVVQTRQAMLNGTALDWIYNTQAKEIVGNDKVARIVKESMLI